MFLTCFSGKRGEGKFPPHGGESEIMLGGIFLLGGENLRRSDFGD